MPTEVIQEVVPAVMRGDSTARDPAVQALAKLLAAPFRASELKFKPQMVKNNRALAIGYIDARLIQDRLDEVLGVENWQDKYDFLPDGSVVCRLLLKLGGRWIAKTDVGSPSEQPDSGDRVKAAVSDALKRAAVKFGIARYLHRLPAQWVDYDPVKKEFTKTPTLPDWAIPDADKPRGRQQPAAVKPAAVTPVAPKAVEPAAVTPAVTPAVPKAVEPKAESEKPAARCNTLPASGKELHTRLQAYDTNLAGQKKCIRGALLAFVTEAGVKAGYPHNMTEWSKPAIEFAVDVVKDFEKAMGVRPVAAAAG